MGHYSFGFMWLSSRKDPLHRLRTFLRCREFGAGFFSPGTPPQGRWGGGCTADQGWVGYGPNLRTPPRRVLNRSTSNLNKIGPILAPQLAPMTPSPHPWGGEGTWDLGWMGSHPNPYGSYTEAWPGRWICNGPLGSKARGWCVFLFYRYASPGLL